MNDDRELEPAPMPNVRWNIGRQGRAWTGDEARVRWELAQEKFEMDQGKLDSARSISTSGAGPWQ